MSRDTARGTGVPGVPAISNPCPLPVPVDLAAVANVDYDYPRPIVFYVVDNAPVANPDSQQVGAPR
jgi:hypothetical protein